MDRATNELRCAKGYRKDFPQIADASDSLTARYMVEDSNRTAIGNHPTCGLCETQHGTDDECPDAAENREESKAQQLLDAAREAQSKFWSAVGALEAEIKADIDSTKDLQGETLETLGTQDDDSEASEPCTCADPSHYHPQIF